MSRKPARGLSKRMRLATESDGCRPNRFKPVPWKEVKPVLKHVLPLVADRIVLQYLTGMTSIEVNHELNPKRVDATTLEGHGCWLFKYIRMVEPGGKDYRLKSKRRKRERTILFGPKAQKILTRWRAEGDDRPPNPRLRILNGRFVLRNDLAEVKPGGEDILSYSHYSSRIEYIEDIKAGCRKAGIPTWRPFRLRQAAIRRFCRVLSRHDEELAMRAAKAIFRPHKPDFFKTTDPGLLGVVLDAVKQLG